VDGIALGAGVVASLVELVSWNAANIAKENVSKTIVASRIG
jgi:hypothetical protein